MGLYGRQLFGVKAGGFFTAYTECYHQNRKSFWMVDLAVGLCSVISKCFHIKTIPPITAFFEKHKTTETPHPTLEMH